ncbi:hypothetical protein ACFQ9Z_14680 [Streptomyces sp. NPDC056580]|uniref:hypothetical protein n=1 Tax=Streptomyces sp. NPDC056580 TaxID=3345872 RepID=UPI0036C83F4D
MPGKVADFLRTTELEPTERTALDQGVTRARRWPKHHARAVAEQRRGVVGKALTAA